MRGKKGGLKEERTGEINSVRPLGVEAGKKSAIDNRREERADMSYWFVQREGCERGARVWIVAQ